MKNKAFVLLSLLLPLAVSAQHKYDTIPMLPDHYNTRLASFERETISKGRTIFVGDDLIEMGMWKNLVKDTTVVNRGIAGDLTFGVTSRATEISRRRPAKIFLEVGVNDIIRHVPDEVVIENIFSIASRLRSASTTVYVQSILPINESAPAFPGSKEMDEHITTINNQLQKYSERLHFTYVDLYSGFVDSQGHLDLKYTSDGIHLNVQGYARWVELLKKAKAL